jgi:ribosomal protein S18 acetylase RimI-like enzyme
VCPSPFDDRPSPRCAPVGAATREALVRMLGRLRVPLGAIGGGAMHRAVATDAVAGDRRVIALVAEVDGEPAGFVVATLATGRYWRTLLLRRPRLLARVLADRVGARLARRVPRAVAPAPGVGAAAGSGSPARAAVPLAPADAAPLRWGDDGPDVAKIGFIGVLPEFRRRGVGEALYAALFDEARARGARAVLARIAHDNVASLRLHHAAGWRLFADAQGPFAVYLLAPLPPSSAPR